MIAGIIAGGSVWCSFYILFLIFPEPLSLAAAVLIAPCASGYFAARIGGSRTAWVVTIVCAVITLVLSLIYIPDISWEYPREFFPGIAMLIVLMVLGNSLFLVFGSSVGLRVREQRQPGEITVRRLDAPSAGERTLPAKRPDSPNASQTRMATLLAEENDLLYALTVLKEGKGLELVSSDLVGEKKAALEKQLLDIILEKERLKLNDEKQPKENNDALPPQKMYSVENPRTI